MKKFLGSPKAWAKCLTVAAIITAIAVIVLLYKSSGVITINTIALLALALVFVFFAHRCKANAELETLTSAPVAVATPVATATAAPVATATAAPVATATAAPVATATAAPAATATAAPAATPVTTPESTLASLDFEAISPDDGAAIERARQSKNDSLVRWVKQAHDLKKAKEAFEKIEAEREALVKEAEERLK